MTTITELPSGYQLAGLLGYIVPMPQTTGDDKTTRRGSAAQRILVVDDQESIRLTVGAALERDGFDVDYCEDGARAIERITADPPALVVLDIGLPGADGMTVLRELRRSSDLPVIMLTARDEEFDRVLGLELGADDYVAKPFSARELVARVKSVLRRTGSPVVDGASVSSTGPAGLEAEESQRFDYGDLQIDLMSREVWMRGAAIETTRREFDLLVMLSGSPRRVFSREQLLRGVWDSSSDWQAPSTVTEHIRRLRQKLEWNPERPVLITTVRGVGYRFIPPNT